MSALGQKRTSQGGPTRIFNEGEAYKCAARSALVLTVPTLGSGRGANCCPHASPGAVLFRGCAIHYAPNQVPLVSSAEPLRNYRGPLAAEQLPCRGYWSRLFRSAEFRWVYIATRSRGLPLPCSRLPSVRQRATTRCAASPETKRRQLVGQLPAQGGVKCQDLRGGRRNQATRGFLCEAFLTRNPPDRTSFLDPRVAARVRRHRTSL